MYANKAMKHLYIALLITFIITGCATKQSILNVDVLPVQTFSINPGVDTIIKTAQGCKINIAAGSIKTTGNQRVSLTIKEAITAEQILLSGLTTVSNNKLLGSGGMVYINAVNAEILKPLKLSIPITVVLPGMQLFKGVKKDDKINWTDPKPLAGNAVDSNVLKGQKLFMQNCASCHSPTLVKDATAPMLWNIQDRRSKQWLNAFILNSAKVINDDLYAYSINKKWHRLAMPKYEGEMDTTDLNNIYAFIKAKSAQANIKPAKQMLCDDSCYRYLQLCDSVRNLMYETPVNKYAAGAIVGALNTTTPQNYYDVTIETFGWINVDVFMDDKPGTALSTVTVNIKGVQEKDIEVEFFMPSVKMFMHATAVNSSTYSFNEYTPMYLPQSEAAFIVAYKQTDTVNMLYAVIPLTTTTNNVITINLKQGSKATFINELKAITALTAIDQSMQRAKNITSPANTAKGRTKNRLIIQARLTALKPVSCVCPLPETDYIIFENDYADTSILANDTTTYDLQP